MGVVTVLRQLVVLIFSCNDINAYVLYRFFRLCFSGIHDRTVNPITSNTR